MAEKPAPRVPILAVNHLTKTIQQKDILKDLSFSIFEDAKVGFLGENGSGKTTLLRILAGEDKEYEGEVRPYPGVTLGYVPQEPRLDPTKDVRGNLEEGVRDIRALLAKFELLSEQMAGDLTPEQLQDVLDAQSKVQDQIEHRDGWDVDRHLEVAMDVRGNLEEGVRDIRALLAKFEHLSEQMAGDLTPEQLQDVLDAQSKVQDQIEHRDGWDVDRHLEVAMEALGCPPPDADVTKLSGGERRRVALCRALMQHPDLLLLDEPTNHLDAATTDWLERFLTTYHGAWILVTHDRWFLEHSTNQMVELDRGRIFVFSGSYSSFLEAKSKRTELEQATESARQRVLARELDWIRSTPSARTVKNKARVARFHELEQQELDGQRGTVELRLPTGPRLGDKVISIKGLRKAYGDRVLIDGLDLEVPPGGILGVVGPNGLGKTTLLRMITGTEKPDAGTVEIGKNTVFCYVDQNRESLDDAKSVFQEVAEGGEVIKVGREDINVRSYLSRFLFKGSDQQKLVGQLSGGERNRLQLAKLLKKGGNVLILDEPTNDLDLDTLRVLEEALISFPGCAIVVTHDRYFLDRTATHILAFEGDGKIVFTEGTYEYYRQKKAERDAAAGTEAGSKKGKYRKMVRPGG